MTPITSHGLGQDGFVDVEGVRIHYVSQGEGAPVIFLHGIPTTLHLWRHILGAVRQTHRAIALDLPGYGDSDKPVGVTYNLDFFDRMLHGFVEQLGLGNFALVGHDLGGMVAVGHAVRHPGRLAKLVILDTYPYAEVSLRAKLPLKLLALPKVPEWIFGSRWGIALSLKLGVVNRSLVTDELIEEYYRPLRRDARARKVSAEILRIDLKDLLEPRSSVAKLDLSTMIIWAEKDRIIPLSVGRELHRVIPGSELKTITQCGHFLPEDRPEEVSRLLLEFL